MSQPNEVTVRCRTCKTRFQMDGRLASRLASLGHGRCPRCPQCELRTKQRTARGLRAYRLLLRRRQGPPTLDQLLSFSGTR